MAVDGLGRYQLSDMQDRVRRLLDAYAISVNTTTGAETIVQIQDQSFSNTDITASLNEALTAIYAQMVMGKESLFATTQYISVEQYNPGPYAFPPYMVQLRWLKWKDYNVPFEPFPSAGSSYSPRPIEWRPMQQCEDPNDVDLMNAQTAPTWRWESGKLWLNTVPSQANQNGIQINFVQLPTELVNATDVISVPQFVRLAQQVAIYDTAYTLAFSKKKQVAEELTKKRDEWHVILNTMVENAYNSQSTQMIAPQRMISPSYTGRFRGLARGGRFQG